MNAPSKSTEQPWHPSSLLAYDSPTIPNPQDDFDSVTSEAKSTGHTTTYLYDRSLTSRRYALAGVACTSIFSIICIVAGATITDGGGAITFTLGSGLPGEMLSLILNMIVTLCTESTGLVHSISLRSALASESRLRFNTNLRLLTAARGWRNPNGSLLNGVMAGLLTLSYTSASLVILSSGFSMTINGVDNYLVCITGLPLLLLGIAILLQVVIALSGMYAVKILTWSSSPFDVTAALVHHAQLTPVPLRCMCNSMTSDLDVGGGPLRPSEKQPSAWRAHPSIRKVILSLWGLVVACAGWAVLAIIIRNIVFRPYYPPVPHGSWSFFPNQSSQSLVWDIPVYGSVNVRWLILTFVAVALVQGPLTLGLHCSELIVNVIQDERRWRRATGRRGLQMMANPLKSFFTVPLNLVLLAAKPVLHWMFGISFKLSTGPDFDYDAQFLVEMTMYITQIWNLCIALFIFACFFTVVALLRPRGPQPAAYGHLQTLANLVDEWSHVMWWGHKEDGIPYCHAGTSDHPLPPVKMDCVYAGSCVGYHPPVSPLVSHLKTYTSDCSSQKIAHNLAR